MKVYFLVMNSKRCFYIESKCPGYQPIISCASSDVVNQPIKSTIEGDVKTSNFINYQNLKRAQKLDTSLTPDTISGLILANSRFRPVISTVYSYCKYFFYLRADYNDASSGFCLWAKTLRGQLKVSFKTRICGSGYNTINTTPRKKTSARFPFNPIRLLCMQLFVLQNNSGNNGAPLRLIRRE